MTVKVDLPCSCRSALYGHHVHCPAYWQSRVDHAIKALTSAVHEAVRRADEAEAERDSLKAQIELFKKTASGHAWNQFQAILAEAKEIAEVRERVK